MRHEAPTVRQVYALAAALCARHGERWPRTREEMSATIERLRLEIGHPAPRLEDTAPRGGRVVLEARNLAPAAEPDERPLWLAHTRRELPS
jgi:hypothetical protein